MKRKNKLNQQRCVLQQQISVLLLTVFLYSCGSLKGYMHTQKALKSGHVTQKRFVRQIPFEKYVSNKIIVEVTLNASTRKYRFILDSGAPMVLSNKVAEELGLIKPGQSKHLPSIVLDKVQIAGLSFHKIGTLLWDLETDPFLSKCAGVDGLIGSSVLKHFIWYFDWRNEKILVSDRRDSLPLPSSAIRLPFTTDNYNRALVACTFPNGKSKKFIFDTGGNGFITGDFKLFNSLKQYMPYRESYGLAGYGGLKEPTYNTSYTARVQNFKVGSITVDTAEVLFARRELSHVGWHFLQNYSFAFDWQQREIILMPYPQQLPLGNPLSFGFNLFYRHDTASGEKHLIVANVSKGSPADQAGLKTGDRVVEVDGKNYQIIGNECDVFEGIEIKGDQTQLTILRSSKKEVVTVKADFVFKK